MTQRRSVLKAVGGLTAIGLTSTVSAKGENDFNKEKPSKEEIDHEIQKAVREYGTDGIEYVLEKQGINYNAVKKPINNNSEIGIQSRYSESSSLFMVYSYEVSGEDRIGVSAAMELRGSTSSFRSAAHVEDVIALTFSSDHWAETATPSISVYEPDKAINESPETEVSLHSDSTDSEFAAAAIDTTSNRPDVDIYLSTELQHTSNVPNPVWGSYEHNWAYTSSGSITDISVDIPHINVDLTNASTAWNIHNGTETDDLV